MNRPSGTDQGQKTSFNSPPVIQEALNEAMNWTQDALRDFPRVVLTAEEILRQRVLRTARLIVATLFFFLSSLVSIGAQVTVALAKKSGTEQSQRKKGQAKLKLQLKHFKQNAQTKQAPRSAKIKRNPSVGTASWYGKQFHNKKTASGKRFDMGSMVAAHRSLPFGTKVRVTNLGNNKSCVVEILDRGPYVGNRLIDLSYAAANELDFASTGTAKVKLEVVSDDELVPVTENLLPVQPVRDALGFPEAKLVTSTQSALAATAAEN